MRARTLFPPYAHYGSNNNIFNDCAISFSFRIDLWHVNINKYLGQFHLGRSLNIYTIISRLFSSPLSLAWLDVQTRKVNQFQVHNYFFPDWNYICVIWIWLFVYDLCFFFLWSCCFSSVEMWRISGWFTICTTLIIFSRHTHSHSVIQAHAHNSIYTFTIQLKCSTSIK